MSVRITCINKDNGDHYDPHLGITHLGWKDESTGQTGKATRSGMIEFLESNGDAYVKDYLGGIAWLVVRVRNGIKYVKTVADGKETNNLLALYECA
ncbi:MAG: DUF3892 domain-containing protein [Candidatus Komeilibacteria bacterium]|nr:DUF3892 domain-containing protein [Candidatus Komeilibacteria bacterium]